MRPKRTVTVSDAVMQKLTGAAQEPTRGACASSTRMPWHGRAAPDEGRRCRSRCKVVRAPAQPAMHNRHAAGLENADGVDMVAELPMPPPLAPAAAGQLQRLLVLEGVQDPGNLGTLLRCALAFGWDGAWLLPGCCDPFNDKALRASRCARGGGGQKAEAAVVGLAGPGPLPPYCTNDPCGVSTPHPCTLVGAHPCACRLHLGAGSCWKRQPQPEACSCWQVNG